MTQPASNPPVQASSSPETASSTSQTPAETAKPSQESQAPAAADAKPEGQGAPAANAKPETKQEDLRSSRFAALSRKEKAIREQEERLKPVIAFAQKFEAAKGNAEKAYELFRELGFSQEEIATVPLKKVKPKTPEDALAERVKQLEDEAKAKAQKDADDAKSRADKAEADYREQIAAVVSKDDRFELTRTIDGYEDLVFQKTADHFQATGEILDAASAAELVEQDLEEWITKRVEATKKVSARRSTSQGSSQASQTPSQQASHEKSSPTLTNGQASNVPARDARPMTEDEAREEAIRILRGN